MAGYRAAADTGKMKETVSVLLPYGREKLEFRIEKDRLAGIITSGIEDYRPPFGEAELVARAMLSPAGSPPLRELARGKRRVTVIASDHTRPVPSRILMPAIMNEIRAGSPDADITILIATGCHRGTTVAELEAKFGREFVEKEKIVIHDCDSPGMTHLGRLPSGGECLVNSIAADADLLVSEGFIEPHFFAGFSGGRKSVLPGVASRRTVLANHCAEFIADPRARAGITDGNPVHRDMLWAAKKAGLAFILNVVLNGKKEIIHAVAGDPGAAHAAGCAFLDSLCGAPPLPADIVVTTNGGYPLDQNIYQSVKGMTAAETCVNPGGVIVMFSKSEDGHGGDAFCRELTAGPDPAALEEGILSRGRDATLPDQWQAQIFLRIRNRARIVYVSDAPDELVRSLGMYPAHSPEEALALADSLTGSPGAKLTVIPDGVGVIVR